MPWTKLCESIRTNPKFRRLSAEAGLLYIMSIIAARQWRTDGFIPKDELHEIFRPMGKKKPRRAEHARELVAAGLWEVTGDGWHIHDYETYQPLEHEDAERRRKNSVRQKRFYDAKRHVGCTDKGTYSAPYACNERAPQQDQNVEYSTFHMKPNAVSNATPDPDPQIQVQDQPPPVQPGAVHPDLGKEPNWTAPVASQSTPSRPPITGLARALPKHTAARWSVGTAKYVPPTDPDFVHPLSAVELQFVLANELSIKGSATGLNSEVVKRFIEGQATRQDVYSATHNAWIKKGRTNTSCMLVALKFADLRELQASHKNNYSRSQDNNPAMFELPNGQTAGRMLTTAKEQEGIRARMASRELVQSIRDLERKHGVK